MPVGYYGQSRELTVAQAQVVPELVQVVAVEVVEVAVVVVVVVIVVVVARTQGVIRQEY